MCNTDAEYSHAEGVHLPQNARCYFVRELAIRMPGPGRGEFKCYGGRDNYNSDFSEAKMGLRWWRDVLIRNQTKRDLDDR